MTDLSIITVSYKGWERLRQSLDSLSSFKGEKVSTEIIIVDNYSNDGVLESLEAEYKSAKFIRNSVNGGFANGCNLGAGAATGEYLLFLNPDTIAREDAIETLVNTARQNPSVSILSCRQVNESGKECTVSGQFPRFNNLTGILRLLNSASRTLHPSASDFAGRSPLRRTKSEATAKEARTPQLLYPDWVSGSVILIRRDLFEKTGGFDEDFWMYYEDVDICKRICDSGGTIALVTEAVIEHNHGGSSRINLRIAAITKSEVHISRHVYMSKHKSGLSLFVIQGFLVLNNLISGAVSATVGIVLFFIPKLLLRTMIFISLVKYYTGVLSGLSWVSRRATGKISVKNH